MGYSNNRTVLPLTNKVNLYSDGCGDTYEKKYYVNGAYIDLCGLSIEEYMNNPCCGGGGNGTPDSDSKVENSIFVTAFIGEDGMSYYQAFSLYPVTSNIKIMVTSISGVATELDLYVGEKQSEPEIGETMEYLGVEINIEEDDNYIYVIKNENVENEYNVYIDTILYSETGSFSNDFEMMALKMGSTTDIRYVIPGTNFNYNDLEDIDEFNKFCQENQHCFVLCLPKSIFDDKHYLISDYSGTDITNHFELVNTFIKDDIEYVFLNEYGVNDITPFVPLYNEDIIYEYKLTLNK